MWCEFYNSFGEGILRSSKGFFFFFFLGGGGGGSEGLKYAAHDPVFPTQTGLHNLRYISFFINIKLSSFLIMNGLTTIRCHLIMMK